jgi:hypothetical protein
VGVEGRIAPLDGHWIRRMGQARFYPRLIYPDWNAIRANQQINAHALSLISQSAGKMDMSHIKLIFPDNLSDNRIE